MTAADSGKVAIFSRLLTSRGAPVVGLALAEGLYRHADRC